MASCCPTRHTILLFVLCLLSIHFGPLVKATTTNENLPPPPLATLPSGVVLSGQTDPLNAVSYWQGVRYAKPPIGDLRFAPTQYIDRDTQLMAPAAISTSSGGHVAGETDFARRLMPLFNMPQLVLGAGRLLNSTARHSMDVLTNSTAYLKRRFINEASLDTLSTITAGPQCPQDADINEQSEDCLYLNVYRTSTAVASDQLPVLLFVHGGGFQSGAGSLYDPTPIINAGVQNGQPIIVVTINYRLNVFGFLASSDLANLAHLDPEGCSGSFPQCTSKNVSSQSVGMNLGYHDISMAIRWTRNNIAAFGGDPSKLVIWGQSAGAFGVGAQLISHPGQPLPAGQVNTGFPLRPYFRGAILMSGNPSGPAIALPQEKDDVWTVTLNDTACGPPLYTTAQSRLNCLRSIDWTILRSSGITQNKDASKSHNRNYVLGNYPFVPVFDGGPQRGGFFVEQPSITVQDGRFASVPLMCGDVEDEGTVFAPHDIETNLDFLTWFEPIWFGTGNISAQNEVFDTVADAYPDDPAVGSPYEATHTQNRFFGAVLLNTSADTNQFKRAASIYGDLRFQASRRWLLEQGINNRNIPAAWSWLFSEPRKTDPTWQGVPHSSDLNSIWKINKASKFSEVMAKQFVAFTTNLNPNGPTIPLWPQYDLVNRQLMTYQADGKTGLSPDTYRFMAMQTLNQEEVRNQTRR